MQASSLRILRDCMVASRMLTPLRLQQRNSEIGVARPLQVVKQVLVRSHFAVLRCF